MTDSRPSILITGASGGLASILVHRLAKEFRLVGVDPRPMPEGRNFPGEFHQVDYTHRKVEDIFRNDHFDTFLHLGRVRISEKASKTQRYNVNVLGTRNLLKLSYKYGIKNLIVFSTFHVYGAHPHNSLYLTEEEPLRAAHSFPEISDAVELDHAATTFLWRHQDVRTVVLRPVNVVGPKINNAITNLLRNKYCPMILGYDPLLQFIHEEDIAEALYLVLKGSTSGIYNIVGEGAVPYTKAIEITGGISVPVPTFFAYPALRILSQFKINFPTHLMDYFCYPTVLSDVAFTRDYHFKPKWSTVEALKSIGR